MPSFVSDAIVVKLQTHLVNGGLAEGDSEALVFTDDAGGPLRYSIWRRRVWLPPAKAASCL